MYSTTFVVSGSYIFDICFIALSGDDESVYQYSATIYTLTNLCRIIVTCDEASMFLCGMLFIFVLIRMFSHWQELNKDLAPNEKQKSYVFFFLPSKFSLD